MAIGNQIIIEPLFSTESSELKGTRPYFGALPVRRVGNVESLGAILYALRTLVWKRLFLVVTLSFRHLLWQQFIYSYMTGSCSTLIYTTLSLLFQSYLVITSSAP